MKIIATNEEYGSIICRFLEMNFPKGVKISASHLLDILTILIIGGKDLRYGPTPSIERQFYIRKSIQWSLDNNTPIQFLIPWGGRKGDPSISLDIADLMAVKQIIKLIKAIHEFYPRVIVHIRIEDSGAKWLYHSSNGVDEYSEGFKAMVNILTRAEGIEKQLVPILESSLMDWGDYQLKSTQNTNAINSALKTGDVSHLENIGWKGSIPKEQAEYYLSRYRSFNPGKTEEQYVEMLAEYFGGALARYQLGGRAAPEGEYINATFASPIPGVPEEMVRNTIYYRTLPEQYARTHSPSWRTKGYLQITGNEVIPKLIHGKSPYLIENFIRLEDEYDTIIIRADYEIRDIIPSGMMI